MSSAIYVINPNSSLSVTQGIDVALLPLRIPGGPRIVTDWLRSGPPGVQSQQDVDGVAMPLVQHCLALPDDCAAVVIACFSDPGLHAVREAMQPRGVPVLGISECAMLTALSMGQRVGVIAILETSIAHHQHIRALLAHQALAHLDHACERAFLVGQFGHAQANRGFASNAAADAHRTVVAHVAGCAGMASYRDALAEATGVPVVEPTQAAAAMALGRARLGW